jgi:hypothetical protein
MESNGSHKVTLQELQWVVGTQAAARLAVLKSLSEDYRRHQTIDFGGAAPEPGPMGVCPCCGKTIQEGVLH